MAQARVSIESTPVADVPPRLFGSFVEHLGRCVYDGLYEPSHPTADEDGFRADVLDLVRELGVTTIRYPGGNFVSGYRWEDGVGPREQRPRRLDLAWHSVETNEVGLDEFARWARRADAELMLAVNLGTRGVAEALDLLEYANIRSGSALSDQRVANGTPEPHRVRMWCLGNEMDGPWQLGHRSADDYGKLAAQTASAMRQLDPDVELVACGSSGAGMPTFGTWERQVLEHCYDLVDFISCHAYFEEEDGDLASFLASSVEVDRFIESVVSTADAVKAALGSSRTLSISFDEWNVWYLKRFQAEEKITDIEEWPQAPRLLEDTYSVADAVVVGSILISLLRHCDRVRAASMAQLVNVIAPIMTEPGGPAWRQTTFHPFAQAARAARGEVLRARVEAPLQDSAVRGPAPLVDAAVTADREAGTASAFLVNRSTTEPVVVVLDCAALGPVSGARAQVLADADPYAKNTLADPDRVAPRALEVEVVDGGLRVELPPVSWAALEWDLAAGPR